VVSQDCVSGAFDGCPQALQALKRRLIRAVSESPVISRQNTEIIAQRLDAPDKCVEELVIHAKMQIRQVQEYKPVEGAWQVKEMDLVMANLESERVAPTSLVQAKEPKPRSNQGWVREPVLKIEDFGALAQSLSSIFRFTAETLHEVWLAEARFERAKGCPFVRGEIRLARQLADWIQSAADYTHRNERPRQILSRVIGALLSEASSGQQICTLKVAFLDLMPWLSIRLA
jgi:hypothetical protein